MRREGLEPPSLTAQDPKSCVSANFTTRPIGNGWKISDYSALGEKKIGRASELLHHILGQGEPPVKVLTMVARHFRLLAKAQGLLRRKVSKTEFAAGLKVNPFFAGDYAAQARKLNPIRWRALFQEIYQTDAALKSSKHKATTILEKLAWDLTRD